MMGFIVTPPATVPAAITQMMRNNIIDLVS